MKTYTLDLHHRLHENARWAVIKFIERHWGSPAELEIITGNSSIMKKITTEVIEEYGLEYTIGRRFDMTNKGYIVTYTE